MALDVFNELTPDRLQAALIDKGILTESGLEKLLGVDAETITLGQLEKRLLDAAVLTEQRLLLLVSEVGSHPAMRDEEFGALSHLPKEVARATSALVVDRPARTVAFVDPTPENIQTVSNALEGATFEVWVMVTSQFIRLAQNVYKEATVTKLDPLGKLTDIFKLCIDREGTDIHVKVGQPPIIRVDGELVRMPTEVVTKDWLTDQLSKEWPQHMNQLIEETAVDLAYEYGSSRFRVNLGANRVGFTIAARLLADEIPAMEKLNLPEAVQKFAHMERGLVLVTGPTGSGKSTTLAAILNHMALHQRRHIITLEDPIEYLLEEGPNAVVNQREHGDSFRSFPQALRQALRQDPDVVLVGEMRDMETAQTAVTAAETGHLVFSTLHTYDAQSTVARLVSMYPTAEQDHAREKLAYILKGVVSQTLLPKLGGKGRVAAMEIMLGTPPIASNLRTASGMSQLRSTIQTSSKDGMQTLETHLARLVRAGKISEEAAFFKARDVGELKQRLATPEL